MPRLPVLLTAALITCVLAASLALAAATGPFVGKSGAGRMSFTISASARYITHFRFVNRCPADSNAGTLVGGRMKIVSGKFSRHGQQFTITGHFTTTGAAGTARDVTGNCDSGILHWRAHAK
jgi:hypothetical protein